MSEMILGNIHMSTRQFGHDCTFTWRLRNLSLLKLKTKPIIKSHFTLHPKCDTKWCIMVYCILGGYEVRVSHELTKCPFVITVPYIGLLNPNGDLVLPNMPEESEMVLKIQLGVGNTVVIGNGVVVELKDDTLVVRGRIVVPSCCTRTEIDKKEITAVMRPGRTHRLSKL